MKRFLLSTLVVALGMTSVTAFGAIAGSGHDFSTRGWNTSGEICIVCHAPHNNQNAAGALLWNHESSSATYTPYTSPTFEEGPTTVGGSSLVCLSCHDGTVAVDSFGGTTGTVNIGASWNIGTDLSDDHPISFTYDSTDEELASQTTSVTFQNGSGTIEDMLEGGTEVQCSSCHDVHNTVSEGAPSLLVKDNDGSALCLTCHTK